MIGKVISGRDWIARCKRNGETAPIGAVVTPRRNKKAALSEMGKAAELAERTAALVSSKRSPHASLAARTARSAPAYVQLQSVLARAFSAAQPEHF